MSSTTLTPGNVTPASAEIKQLSADLMAMAHAAYPLLDDPSGDDVSHAQRLLIMIKEAAEKVHTLSCNIRGI